MFYSSGTQLCTSLLTNPHHSPDLVGDLFFPKTIDVSAECCPRDLLVTRTARQMTTSHLVYYKPLTSVID